MIFAQETLPPITVDELADIVRNDYARIESLAVKFSQSRVESPANMDPGMYRRMSFLVRGDQVLKVHEGGFVDPTDGPMVTARETRSWDGKTQRLYNPDARQGVVTEETEHHLYLDNTYYQLGAIDRADPQSHPAFKGTLLDFLDSGYAVVRGIDLVQDRPCYKIGWIQSFREGNGSERVFWVDPGYGFAPVKEVFFKLDDPERPIYITEGFDFERVEGFTRRWPYRGRITWHQTDIESGARTKIVDEIEVEELSFPAEITDSDLKIEFPPGTLVEDRVIGVFYTVPEADNLAQLAADRIEASAAGAIDVDDDNKASSPDPPLPPIGSAPQPAALADDPSSSPGTYPLAATLIGSIGLVIALAGLLYFRSKRSPGDR